MKTAIALALILSTTPALAQRRTCDPTQRKGTYTVTFTRISGTCNIPPTLTEEVNFTPGDGVGVSADGCVVYERTMSDFPNGRFVGLEAMTEQVGKSASKLRGIVAVTILQDGEVVCKGVYRVAMVRVTTL